MWRYFHCADVDWYLQGHHIKTWEAHYLYFFVLKVKIYLFSLNALIALSLVYSWKCFSEEENEILFNRILQTIAVFQNVQYSPKVLITAFTQMLMMYEVPFINRRFVQILDLTISLLEFLSQNKTSYFAKEEDSDEIEYSNSLILLKNDMKSMD